jgi:hypothetical protein
MFLRVFTNWSSSGSVRLSYYDVTSRWREAGVHIAIVLLYVHHNRGDDEAASGGQVSTKPGSLGGRHAIRNSCSSCIMLD